MAKKQSNEWVKVSGYLFLLGVLIALIAGITAVTGTDVIPFSKPILAVIGLIMGLLGAVGMGSISENDREMMLLATIALMVVGVSGQQLLQIPEFGVYLKSIVDYIAILVAPAAVILALKAIWKAGSTKYM